MSPFRRRQFFGWAVLGVAALLGLGWLAHLDFSKKISTDVLDLIPAAERAPEIALVRELASETEARVMLFVLLDARNQQPVTAEVSRRFAAELAHSPAFEQAVPLVDAGSRGALGKELFDQRLTLLFPLWLREREAAYTATGAPPAGFTDWLAKDAASSFGRFLSSPEALAMQDVLPSDPLLLMPGLLNRLKGALALVQPADQGKMQPALVWARIAAPPLREEGQAPVFAAIQQAAVATRAQFPDLLVQDTGVNRLAAASRARIEKEVSWLNALSLIAVLAVALVFIRRIHRGLHLLPVVLCSVLGAWVVSTMVFDRLHIMVFVVGSLLTGVAIDYGFYLYMQPPAVPDEDYWSKARRLAKPLLASCFTTVAGFALLTASELPLIRQLGVFVGAGLICALGAAVVYFSTVKNSFLETRTFRGGQALRPQTRRNLWRALVALWVLALPGLFLLKWKDDIRGLEVASADLKKNDAWIRSLFGDGGNRAVYLTQGNTITEARTNLEKFTAWLRSASTSPTTTSVSLGAVVPNAADHARAVKFVREETTFIPRLRAALDQSDVDAAGFTPFFETYAQYAARAQESDLEPAVLALHRKLGGPMGMLLHLGKPLTWFVTLTDHPPATPPPAEFHTVSASQLQSLNNIFARYRQSALHLSLIGLAIVGLGVFLTYGLRDGVRIFAIPCGACLGLFGVLGWLGLPLNLFHLLGAFLGVCLTHNYSIFSVTSAYAHEPPPASVRLSALCTAASFGVLALSGIPVVRALGSTVALMVLAALLVIEFEHFGSIAKPKP